MIYEHRTYTDDQGRAIVARIPDDGGAPVYIATFVFVFTQGGQKIRADQPWPLMGPTVGEAFASLPAAEAEARKHAEAEFRKQLLAVPVHGATPNGSPPLRMVGA